MKIRMLITIGLLAIGDVVNATQRGNQVIAEPKGGKQKIPLKKGQYVVLTEEPKAPVLEGDPSLPGDTGEVGASALPTESQGPVGDPVGALGDEGTKGDPTLLDDDTPTDDDLADAQASTVIPDEDI